MGDKLGVFVCFLLPLNYIDFNSSSSMKNKPLPSSNLTKLDNQFQIPRFKGLLPGITSSKYNNIVFKNNVPVVIWTAGLTS